MQFHETLSAALPPRRHDEPASLRQEILDELNDHLATAIHRELVRGLDAETARIRALEAFGDPAAVARLLWLDAMKGKIMAQRVLIATCLVVTIASVALAGLVWVNATQAARQAAEAERRMADAMAVSRATSEEMLKQLQAIAKGDQSGRSADWIPVTFKLVQETLDGPPAVGCVAYLGRGSGGSMKTGSIHRESDEKGLIDFGVVQPGDWEFGLLRPSEDGRSWKAQGDFNVLPGIGVAKTIICPREYSENIPVRIRVDWPAELADRNLHVAALFEFAGITYQAPLRWHLGPWPGMGQVYQPVRNVLCRPGGKLAELDVSHFFLWRVVGKPDGSAPEGPVLADVSPGAVSTKSDVVEFAAGDYRLDRLIVLRPARAKAPDSLQAERYDFISQMLRGQHLDMDVRDRHRMNVHRLVAAPSKGVFAPAQQGETEQGDGVAFPSSYLGVTRGRFTARTRQSNEWVVPLPDELIKLVREYLKAGETSGKQ
jgi:hypothetical protein